VPVVARGARAPSFPLPEIDGGALEIPGTAPLTLLVFLKASCPTCRWTLPFVRGLHERAAGLSVLPIASDSAEDARALSGELGPGIPVAVESEPWEVSAAYGLEVVPTLILVGESGRILLVSEGFVRDDFRAVAAEAARTSGAPPADPFPAGEAVPAFRPG
jgi:thiol-disulfide isomerase/thioredoxin